MSVLTSQAVMQFSARDGISSKFKYMGSQSKRFGKNARSSFAQASRGAHGFRTVLSGMKGLLAGVGVAMVARQAKTAVMDFAKAGDEIAKTSRQIGLSAESLQELRFAADRQGVSNGMLTSSLQKLNKNVGDAKAGTGTLTTFLRKSNPELLKQFQSVKSNEEAFNLFTKEINKLPNQIEKAAFAQAFMGRSGQEMMKFVEAGPDGILALRQEAQKYGIVMSTQVAEGSEKFIDSLTNMNSAFKGLGMSIIGGGVKPITELMQSIANFISDDEKMNALLADTKDILETSLPIIGGIVGAWAAYNAIIKVQAAYESALATAKLIHAVATGKLTLAQVGLNMAMWASPITWIVLAIGLLIGVIIYLALNWDTVKIKMLAFWEVIKTVGIATIQSIIGFFKEWGNTLLLILGPFGMIINVIIALVIQWDTVKAAFKSGGIIGAIKQIGSIIFLALIMPLQKVLSLIAKIPGVGKFAQAANQSLDKLTAPNAGTAQAEVYAKQSLDIKLTNETDSDVETKQTSSKKATPVKPVGANT